MAKHGVAPISTTTTGAGIRTCAADPPCARHQSVFDAAMAPAQESGLRENCTSRLSERAEAGRKLHLSRLYTDEAVEQRGLAPGGDCGGKGLAQGERRPDDRSPDTEPGSCVEPAGRRAPSGATRQESAVHRLAASHHRRPTEAKLHRTQA